MNINVDLHPELAVIVILRHINSYKILFVKSAVLHFIN